MSNSYVLLVSQYRSKKWRLLAPLYLSPYFYYDFRNSSLCPIFKCKTYVHKEGAILLYFLWLSTVFGEYCICSLSLTILRKHLVQFFERDMSIMLVGSWREKGRKRFFVRKKILSFSFESLILLNMNDEIMTLHRNNSGEFKHIRYRHFSKRITLPFYKTLCKR